VLDVCCGTGILASELAARGYLVTGIDASAAMLDVARERLGPEADLVHAAVPALPVEGTFDAAVSTFDGLNYLTPGELAETIAAVAARLRPRGWLVFDLHTDAMLEFTAANPVVAGNGFVISSRVDAGSRACETTIEVSAADGESFSESHRQWFHADADVRTALEDAGFAGVAVTDEYTTTPPGAETFRATWISRLA
jgi:predicted TPR repeat methyltransferase